MADRAAAPPGNTAEIAVAVTTLLESPSGVALLVLPETQVLGRAVTLTLAAFSSAAPIVGGTVAVDIVAPGGTVSNLVLRDDGVLPDRAVGDGLYSGAVAPAETGAFDALATFTGVTPGGQSVVRQAGSAFTVVAPTLALLGAVGTRTVDLNFNGLIDELILDVGVSVLQDGDFSVRVVLSTPAGTSVVSRTQIALTTADGVVPVTFTAEQIRSLGVDGPYAIGPVEIAFLGPSGAQPADRLESAGQTPPLSLADFERPLIST